MNSILLVKNLSKTYTQGETSITVLNKLNLEVKKGETSAILGPSGSGKSTLLSLICGLDSPDSGEIHLSNSNMIKLDEKSLARFRGKNIGIVFQQFHLMNHLTALENVSLPLEIAKIPKPQEKAKEALSKVKLEHRIHHYPNQMSGGENQRVAIARAFVVNPTILIADEPSGNIDQDTGEQVMDILFDQVRSTQMTLLLVTHNQSLAKKCDKIYTLSHGKLESTER